MNAFATQVIDADRVRIEGTFKLSPSGIVTQLPQDSFKPIVAQIGPFNGLACERAKGQESTGHPRFNVDEAVIASR
jgi:hypothetical protein